MNNSERQYIQTLFETENFAEIYQVQAEIINEMLSIDNRQDFEGFLDSENFIVEDNLDKKIELCNQRLTDTDYSLQLDFDDTYYAGVYFLSVIS